MKALVLPDRPSDGLGPLIAKRSAGLLPVLAKPVLVYALEDIAGAGVTDVTVIVSTFGDQLRSALGGGERWGLELNYLLATGWETIEVLLHKAGRQSDEEWLVVRGDVLRTPMLESFLEGAPAKPEAPVLAAQVEGRSAGLWLVRADAEPPLDIPLDPEDEAAWSVATGAIAIEGGKVNLLASPKAFHRANLDAAAGKYDGLLLAAREVAVGVHLGRNSRLPLRTARDWPLFVGSRCDVHREAEMKGNVVVSDDVVIDRQASLRSTVVLPFTYVGELVEVDEAIVDGNTLIRVDTGAVARVTDAFLLADLKSKPVAGAVGKLMHRLGGLVLLVLTLPLWPIALLLSAFSGPVWRRRVLRGNRTVVGAAGALQARDFTAYELATRVPLLRRLPSLLAVVAGDLDLVGVSALTPEQADSRTEEWEFARDRAAVGLFGPTQLTLPAAPPDEERLLTDAFYAQTQTRTKDFAWLLRGLFGRRAWWPQSSGAPS